MCFVRDQTRAGVTNLWGVPHRGINTSNTQQKGKMLRYHHNIHTPHLPPHSHSPLAYSSHSSHNHLNHHHQHHTTNTPTTIIIKFTLISLLKKQLLCIFATKVGYILMAMYVCSLNVFCQGSETSLGNQSLGRAPQKH